MKVFITGISLSLCGSLLCGSLLCGSLLCGPSLTAGAASAGPWVVSELEFGESDRREKHGIQEEYRVGDRIRIEILGDETEATVTEINRNGWLWVECQGRRARQRMLVRPQDVIGKVEPAGDHAGLDGGMGDEGGENVTPDNPQAELRVWTDNRGNTIEARIIELHRNRVKLQKQDGETIQIGIAELSASDVQVAMAWNAGRVFGERAEKRKPGMPAPEVDPETMGYKTVKFDFAETRPIKAGVTGWNLKRDTLPAESAEPNHQDFSMELPASHSGGVLRDPRVASRGFVVGTNVLDPPTGFLFDDQSGAQLALSIFPLQNRKYWLTMRWAIAY